MKRKKILAAEPAAVLALCALLTVIPHPGPRGWMPTSSAWAANATSSWKIVPGMAVGPIQLGMDWKACDALLTRTPDPSDLIQGAGGPVYARYMEGIELEMDKGKVLQIVVKQPKKATAVQPDVNGFRVGGTVQQMESAFGRNYQAMALKVGTHQTPETSYAYTSLGIGFVSRGQEIYQIAIWHKK